MCLFITVTPRAEANRTAAKRALKAASFLSAYSGDETQASAFYLANNEHCACDLRESGPEGADAEIGLRYGVGAAVGAAVTALLNAVGGPVEVRIYWAKPPDVQRRAISLREFSELAASNVFSGNAVYVVTNSQYAA